MQYNGRDGEAVTASTQRRSPSSEPCHPGFPASHTASHQDKERLAQKASVAAGDEDDMMVDDDEGPNEGGAKAKASNCDSKGSDVGC